MKEEKKWYKGKGKMQLFKNDNFELVVPLTSKSSFS